MAIARGINAASGVEGTGLMANGVAVGIAVEFVCTEVGIPGFGAVESGGVDKKDISSSGGLLIVQAGIPRYGIGGIAAGGQGSPAAIMGIVGTGGGRVGREIVGRLE